MDVVWMILGAIFLLGGLAGAVLPILPGPPISFIGIVFFQFTDKVNISVKWMWIMGIAAVVITVLDYIVPSYFTKKYGAHWFSSVMAFVGMIIGLIFFPPLGLIIGPFIGAFLGELMVGRIWQQGLKSAFASFLGFLFGTMLKLIYAFIAIVIIVHFWGDIEIESIENLAFYSK
ncbi:MAG: DUF456 domain-containing protein [Cryomorphaceae bacterium]|nr:DUF456 domain-containing protein [Cryomorphaceae bacterium]